MNKKIFWPFVVSVFAQAILSFGKTGVVGAVLSALVILGVAMNVFDAFNAMRKEYKERQNNIEFAEKVLESAEAARETALANLISNPADPAAKAEYMKAHEAVQLHKKELAQHKKAGHE